MLATALRKDSGETVRQCALTRARLPVGDLLRFCLDPEGNVVPDLKNHLPGRGVWLTATRTIVLEAAKKGIFQRGFRATAQADTNLADTVDTLLAKAALGRLSLANKAGLVTAGFTKVSEVFDRGQAVLLLHASDAAPAGREKLDAKAGRSSTLIIDRFNSEQLSLALGRSNVIHAALSEGGACESFLRAADRLETYRSPGAAIGAASNSATDTQ